MQPFSTSYKKAINQQQGRVGPVFQGPFKSKRIDKNEYLLQLSRYIHLNPVIAGMVRLPEEWEYSSYLDYIGKRTGMVLNWDIILSQFIPFLPKNLQETSKESSLQKAQQAYQAFVVEGDNSLDLPEILLLN